MNDFFAQRYKMTIVLEAPPHLSFRSPPIPNGTFGRGIVLYSFGLPDSGLPDF